MTSPRLQNHPKNRLENSVPFLSRLWQGLPLQLFLAVVLPLTVLLLVVTFGSLRLHHQAMRSLVGDRNLRAVQAAAASLGKEIEHHKALVGLIASTVDSQADAAAYLGEIQPYLEGFRAVGVWTPDGTLQGAYPPSEGFPEPEREQIRLFLEGQNGQRLPGEVLFDVLGQEQGITTFVTAASSPSGRWVVGLLEAAPFFQQGLAGISGSPRLTVLVIRSRDQILYQIGSLLPVENLQEHPGVRNAGSGESGIDYFQTGEGEHVVTYSPVPSTGWVLMIEESWEEIASPLLQATQAAPLILIPILLIALLALWFVLYQIVRPLQALQGQAARLGQGDFAANREPVGGVPEIQHLQKALEQMSGDLQAAQDSLHEYIGALTAGVENERRNLARDLHDDTLQALIVLNQHLQRALRRRPEPGEEESLTRIQSLVQQTMTNLRRVVRGLRPIYLEDLGLVAALGMLATDDERPANLQVRFSLAGPERRLNPEIEMALYRIAQEALSNVARHARAQQAWITLSFEPDQVILEIRDDGKGFSVPAETTAYARQGHYGLLGMQERAELIGARLQVTSAPGEGTSVMVWVPEPKPGQG